MEEDTPFITDELATIEILGWRFTKRSDATVAITSTAKGTLVLGPEETDLLSSLLDLSGVDPEDEDPDPFRNGFAPQALTR